MRRQTGLAVLALAAAAGAAGAIGWAVRDVRAALGSPPTGERAARVRRSPQFRDGAFRNRVPATVLPPGSGKQMLRELLSGEHRRHPSGPVPVVTTADPAADPAGTADGLHVIWYGHSSTRSGVIAAHPRG
jgi:hypothetical protein